MVREKKATEFEHLPSHIKTKFLERSIFNDAGLSEELDRRWWGAGRSSHPREQRAAPPAAICCGYRAAARVLVAAQLEDAGPGV